LATDGRYAQGWRHIRQEAGRSGLLVCLLWATACAHSQTGPPHFEPPPEAALAYRVTLTQLGLNPTAEVEMVARAVPGSSLADPLSLSVPHCWAGHDELDRDIEALVVSTDGDDSPEVTRGVGRIEVAHGGASEVRVAYRFRPRARRFSLATRFRGVGTGDLVFAYGRNLFVVPVGASPEQRVHLELASRVSETRWASTLGWPARRSENSVTTSSTARLDWLLDGAFMGGRLRVVDSGAPGAAVRLAVDPQLPLVEDALVDRVARLVEVTAQRLGPPPGAQTVALVVLRQDDPLAMTGSGRPGGFVLELGQAVSPTSAELAALLAHENLHRYIGMWLRFAAEDEWSTLWFKEGVVDYLAAQMMVRAGLHPPSSFLRLTASRATAYLTRSGSIEAEHGPDPSQYWQNGSLRRLPYDLGYLAALWLDVALRRQGDSLERAVAALLEQRGGSRVDLAVLRRHFEARLDGPLDRLFEDYLAGRRSLPVERWLAEAGLVMRATRRSVPYYGVEVRQEWDGRWRLVGVDPLGPAAGLALRPGEALLEPPSLPASGQTRRARLVVERDGQATVVAIPPVPGEQLTWAIVPTGAGFYELMAF
jgi:predicted metalloprotease with PDZ domain